MISAKQAATLGTWRVVAAELKESTRMGSGAVLRMLQRKL